MAVLASDNFNRANETPLAAPWDHDQSQFNLSSNIAVPSDLGFDTDSAWNSGTWPDDQYAQAKISVTGGGAESGPGLVLRNNLAGTYYWAVVSKAASNNVAVAKWVSNSYTLLASRTTTWVDGDTLRFEVSGNTLKVFQNGVQLGADITGDAAIASGKPGIAYASTTSAASIDDFEAGDFLAETNFPRVASTAESSTNTAGTSHTVNWPSGVEAGDLLLLILDKGSTAATINAHADVNELLDENLANGLYIAWRKATGGETSITLTSSATTRTASITYRIQKAQDPTIQPPQIASTGTGTSATPDPPSLTPTGGAQDYLWIAFYGAAGEEADDDTWSNTPPTNFGPTPPLQKSCGTGGTNLGGLIAAATQQLNASTLDPGTFAKDVSAAWRSQTIAIYPVPQIQAEAQTGLASLGLSGDATAVKVAKGVSTDVLGLSAHATAVKVTAQTSRAVIGLSGHATAKKVAPESTTVLIGLSAHATAKHIVPGASTVAAGLSGSGAALKKQAQTGIGSLGLSGRGPTQAERVVQGRLYAALGGYASAVKVATPLSRSVVGLSGTSSAKKVALPTATVLIGLLGRGAPAKRATPLATSAMGLLGRGAGVHVGKPPGVAAVGFSGRSGALNKLVAASARAFVALTSYGEVFHQVAILGPADIIDYTKPTRLRVVDSAVTLIPHGSTRLHTLDPAVALESITGPTSLDELDSVQ